MIPAADRSDLAKSMIDLADKLNAKPDHELRTKAAAFEAAVRGYFADPPTVTVRDFVGAWARARKTLAEHSGRPLI